ncbi:hypothetical protein ACI2KH_14720 [Roseomonas mucosa]|uniref:hypothetical protein n=1 Tax=Roseomonas mucosa TaxID=207340 RepID=UPI0038509B01
MPLIQADAALLNSRVVNVAALIGTSHVIPANICRSGAIALGLRAVLLVMLNALCLLEYLFKRVAHG